LQAAQSAQVQQQDSRASLDTQESFHIDDGSINLADVAERLDFIAPKVGRLSGNRVVKIDPNDPIAVSKLWPRTPIGM
jgi:hypothetical protein